MFKVGDRVKFDSSLSDEFSSDMVIYGVVSEIDMLRGYPVLVVFDNYDSQTFDMDGRYYDGDHRPSLSILQSEDERKEFFTKCGKNVGKSILEIETTNVTIPVSALLAGETYNGHHQSQLALHGLKDIELISDIAKAFEAHLIESEGFGGFVWTQVWPDGAWAIYKEETGKQIMLLSSRDQ